MDIQFVSLSESTRKFPHFGKLQWWLVQALSSGRLADGCCSVDSVNGGDLLEYFGVVEFMQI